MDTAKYKEDISKVTTQAQRLANQVSKIDVSIPAPSSLAYGVEDKHAKPTAIKVILLIVLIIALTVAGLTYWLI